MSKYVDILPDIDTGQDVFETDAPDPAELVNDHVKPPPSPSSTTSVPLHHPHVDDEQQQQSGIIKTRIIPAEATARFANSQIDATDADFSGRVGRRKKPAHYRTYHTRRMPDADEYEFDLLDHTDNTNIDARKPKESRLQRLRRLVYEVQELEEEIQRDGDASNGPAADNINSSNLNSETKPAVSQLALLDQISALQTDLSNLAKSTGVSGRDAPSLEDGSGSLIKQAELSKALVAQLRAFKDKSVPSVAQPIKQAEAPVSSQTTQKIARSDQHVTYELYYAPETARLTQLSNLGSLESRITNLERVIGISYLDDGLNNGDGNTAMPLLLESGSLMAAMERFETQLTLLTQPRKLETVSRRVKSITIELERLAEAKKKEHLESSLALHSSVYGLDMTGTSHPSQEPPHSASHNNSNDNEQRVKHLFNTLEKLDPIVSLVPHLLSRLQSLRSLHTEAAVFAESLRTLAIEQNHVTESASNIGESVTRLQDAVKDNANVVQSNVEALDARIKSLISRIDKLHK
ncbi:hypothetical protein SmJEL517_g04965 [Synchytrium microbalum]|uniref:Dynactin subunit 2 n=1 Tax=Synchytrium microbalum TaxID=1806994 RepID=A0A507C1G7_9FUNG|nr:uncharacterized protein SmJEL517_g04965 [Synchytrium microbalum]TPX31796.1 hypothetical protein SmJEL517_g04965 [Synchytrium microbalum]